MIVKAKQVLEVAKEVKTRQNVAGLEKNDISIFGLYFRNIEPNAFVTICIQHIRSLARFAICGKIEINEGVLLQGHCNCAVF